MLGPNRERHQMRSRPGVHLDEESPDVAFHGCRLTIKMCRNLLALHPVCQTPKYGFFYRRYLVHGHKHHPILSLRSRSNNCSAVSLHGQGDGGDSRVPGFRMLHPYGPCI